MSLKHDRSVLPKAHHLPLSLISRRRPRRAAFRGVRGRRRSATALRHVGRRRGSAAGVARNSLAATAAAVPARLWLSMRVPTARMRVSTRRVRVASSRVRHTRAGVRVRRQGVREGDAGRLAVAEGDGQCLGGGVAAVRRVGGRRRGGRVDGLGDGDVAWRGAVGGVRGAGA